MTLKNVIILVVFATAVCFGSCRRDSFLSGSEAKLGLSTDSIYFDTVFTTAGSVTNTFKIYNSNKKKLLISSISLNNSTSYFRINADGRAGPVVRDIEVEANDSIYVFVTVKVDSGNTDLPFIVEDSIAIQYNGNSAQVKLSAWGQNANFMRSEVIGSDTTWTNERPFVIIGGLAVDEAAKLTIEKGSRIYLHADAPMLVFGTLEATGEKFDSTKIIFQSDRLDEGYRDYPGSWPGIYFGKSSHDNKLTHVIVRNAYQGTVAEDPSINSAPKLSLRNCVIDNCFDAGIIGSYSDIDAVNCLISNCGKNLVLIKGGHYNFVHCTVAAISNSFIQHKQAVCTVSDFIKEGDNIIGEPLDAGFTNCIFWGANGTVDNEVIVLRETNESFRASFQNCLWKNREAMPGVSLDGMIENIDPLFANTDNTEIPYDFRLMQGSPAIRAGADANIGEDLEEKIRDPDTPDIGAYESAF